MTDLMFSDVAHQMYIVEIIEESLYMSRLIKDIVLYRLSAFITTFYSYYFAFKGKGVKWEKSVDWKWEFGEFCR